MSGSARWASARAAVGLGAGYRDRFGGLGGSGRELVSQITLSDQIIYTPINQMIMPSLSVSQSADQRVIMIIGSSIPRSDATGGPAGASSPAGASEGDENDERTGQDA